MMDYQNTHLSVHRFWLLVHQKNFMVLAFVFLLVWMAGQYSLTNSTGLKKYAFPPPTNVAVTWANLKSSALSTGTDRRPASLNPITAMASTPSGQKQITEERPSLFKHPTQAIVLLLLAMAIVFIIQTSYWWGFKHGALNRTTFEKAHPKEIFSLMGGIILGTMISIVAWGILIGAISILGLALHLDQAGRMSFLCIYIGLAVLCLGLAFFIFLRWYYAAFAAMAISGKGSTILAVPVWKTIFKELHPKRVFQMLLTQVWSVIVFGIYFCIIAVVMGVALGMAGAFEIPSAAQFGASLVGIWLGITGTTAIGYYLGQAYFRMFKMA